MNLQQLINQCFSVLFRSPTLEYKVHLFFFFYSLLCVWLPLVDIYVFIYFLSVLCSSGILEWPFWTKLVVVAIGFTGGLVFMYVQCKVYIHLWRRLKAYNRVIYVQNRPETYKKYPLEKPPLMEPSLENKEALAPNLSDTNSSQYTETEDYSMEVLHVWHQSLCHWLSCTYSTPKQARRGEEQLWLVTEEHPYPFPWSQNDPRPPLSPYTP